MKRLSVAGCLVLLLCMCCGTALGEDIKGRLGVTGKLGFLVPADNDSDFYRNRTDAGVVGGGGFLYGIDDNFTAELDVTRTSFGSETGDFGITNVTLGGQYRFLPRRQLVPFIGLGMDILLSDYDPYDGSARNVDSTVGLHVSGGVDYFLQRSLALTAEGKLMAAPDVDITDRSGARRGSFDPSSFSGTFGVRYFFN